MAARPLSLASSGSGLWRLLRDLELEDRLHAFGKIPSNGLITSHNYKSIRKWQCIVCVRHSLEIESHKRLLIHNHTPVYCQLIRRYPECSIASRWFEDAPFMNLELPSLEHLLVHRTSSSTGLRST